MFVQFNFGDPSERVRDAIGDHLQDAVEASVLLDADLVGRLAGWGSWVDEASGERYLEQSGSVQFVIDAGEPVEHSAHYEWHTSVVACFEAIAEYAADKFGQDTIAVLVN